MTPPHACPVCATPAPTDRIITEPWCCSLACYRRFHRLDEPEPPSRQDAVTMTCPVCQQTFAPTGRQTYCSDACRAAAYRRRRDTTPASVVVPNTQPRRPITVYECDTCGTRAVGEQRCADCATFMRRVGIGGSCPCCGEPVAVIELVGQEVIASR